MASNENDIENIVKKQEEKLLCEIYCQVEKNYNLKAHLECEVDVMARKHDTEFEDDEFENTTLYGGFDSVKEDNMKYALKETFKETKEQFEREREHFDYCRVQTIEFELNIY